MSAQFKVQTADDVRTVLSRHGDELRRRKVHKLYLFGSMARGESTDDSDIDLLMEHGRPMGLIAMSGLQRYLERILGRRVDLGTDVRDSVRQSVDEDLIDVF
ncbi:MAG: nucleotidyltransferase domain-containing protein [Cyanobacteria bacterium P01_H01_bin.130]